jgi:uncharacterized protein YbcC (UPF0753/DUF2309 family)
MSNTARTDELVFSVDDAIEHIAHWLPTQNPIKDFVHHNTLHAVDNRHFTDALAVASRVFGAKSSLPIGYYQKRYRKGRIHEFAIEAAVERLSTNEVERSTLRTLMFEADREAHYPPPSIALDGIKQGWLTKLEINLDALVHPILFRLISNFLDQGISHWPVALPDETLWECVRRLVEESFIPLYPFQEPEARRLLQQDEETAIRHCLERLVGDEMLFGTYLLEMSLGHPGWSGMVHVIEAQPDSLLFKRKISLKAFIAVELLMQLAIMNMKLGPRLTALAETPPIGEFDSFASALTPPPIPLHLQAWQEAMEHSLYAELLTALQKKPKTPTPTPKIQALFCIDDRECSIRRHLEEINPEVETFGAAGFFGIEFFYKGLNDIYPVAQCPVVITPKHVVVENGPENTHPAPTQRAFAPSHPLKNWLTTQTLGLGYAARLAIEVFRPGTKTPSLAKLSQANHRTQLHLLRSEENTHTPDGRLLGFSREEMADRLENLLRSIGLTHNFAPLVMVVAHGASSANNPHFAAYDCGACSGKPGAPNARAFAQMANDPGVRAILLERGIAVPESTRFIPALHDTTRDEVTYFDVHQLEGPEPEGLAIFRNDMKEALLRNAHERCRWFELGPKAGKPSAASAHVKLRATSIFEPRPELNHSNNLYCIVGRRSLTRGLFMDRRAFLHSYDPNQETEGRTLARILCQVIPVCGGINLEYYFSAVDNSIYGAGTKLPHNVVGLLGVANGVEGDLRTGLPSQMIEVHEPARLLIAVEQKPEMIDLALTHIGSFKDWLDKEWVHLVSIDPSTRKAFFYQAGTWNPFEIPESLQSALAPSSRAAYEGHKETVPVHILDPRS